MSAHNNEPLTKEQMAIIRDLGKKATDDACGVIARTVALANDTGPTTMTLVSLDVAGGVLASTILGMLQGGVSEADVEQVLDGFMRKLRRTIESAKKEDA